MLISRKYGVPPQHTENDPLLHFSKDLQTSILIFSQFRMSEVTRKTFDFVLNSLRLFIVNLAYRIHAKLNNNKTNLDNY